MKSQIKSFTISSRRRIAIPVLLVCSIFTFTKTAAQDSISQMPSGCLIYLSSQKSPIKSELIWSIRQGNLEYKAEGSLHDIKIENILYIQCGKIRYEVAGDSLINSFNKPKKYSYGATSSPYLNALDTTGIDYAALGREDAEKYYSMIGPAAAGFFTGIFVVPPLIMACSTPRPSQENNPNSKLYYSIPEYRHAYRKRAHGKKALGIALGLCTLIAVIGMASQ